MLINSLLEEIQNLTNQYNEDNGMLSENLEIKYDFEKVSFEEPVIESFDPEIFEAISEDEIQSTQLSDKLYISMVGVCESLSDIYKALYNSEDQN